MRFAIGCNQEKEGLKNASPIPPADYLKMAVRLAGRDGAFRHADSLCHLRSSCDHHCLLCPFTRSRQMSIDTIPAVAEPWLEIAKTKNARELLLPSRVECM